MEEKETCIGYQAHTLVYLRDAAGLRPRRFLSYLTAETLA